MPALAVQVHHLRAAHREPRAPHDVHLHRHVRQVLRLRIARRLHLDEHEPVPHPLEDVHRHEDAVGQEARLVDDRRPGRERRSRRRDAPLEIAVRQIDQHAARHVRPRERTHAMAAIEETLLRRPDDELGRLRLVGGPPELLRALEADEEAGLGEARGPRGAVRRRLLHRGGP